MLKFVLLFILTAHIYILVVESQNNSIVNTANSLSYCFQFTWPGPQYDEEHPIMNATCDDLLNGVKGIPCHHPLAITDNSNAPDTMEIWEEHKNEPLRIACRLTRGDVCAKYTYYFNQEVVNISYFCTKVNIEDVGAATSGCYTELRNGREIELCLCQSRPGQRPCNDATKTIPNILGIFIIGFIIFLQQF